MNIDVKSKKDMISPESLLINDGELKYGIESFWQVSHTAHPSLSSNKKILPSPRSSTYSLITNNPMKYPSRTKSDFVDSIVESEHNVFVD